MNFSLRKQLKVFLKEPLRINSLSIVQKHCVWCLQIQRNLALIMTYGNMWHRRTVHLLVAREIDRKGPGSQYSLQGETPNELNFHSLGLKISPLLSSTVLWGVIIRHMTFSGLFRSKLYELSVKRFRILIFSDGEEKECYNFLVSVSSSIK